VRAAPRRSASGALFNPLRFASSASSTGASTPRHDTEAIVVAFGARLRDAVDRETVRDELERAIGRAVEAAHVSVRVSRPSTPRG
jgi:hypothetical protein